MTYDNNIQVITKNNEFKRIYAKGEYFVAYDVVTYVFKNNGRYKPLLKYGITASKKVGNAVKRNRAKRLIRAAIAELLPNIKQGYSIVFVARQKTPFVKSYNVKKSILKHLAKADVLKNNVDLNDK